MLYSISISTFSLKLRDFFFMFFWEKKKKDFFFCVKGSRILKQVGEKFHCDIISALNLFSTLHSLSLKKKKSKCVFEFGHRNTLLIGTLVAFRLEEFGMKIQEDVTIFLCHLQQSAN